MPPKGKKKTAVFVWTCVSSIRLFWSQHIGELIIAVQMWALSTKYQGEPLHKLPASTLPAMQGRQNIQLMRFDDTYPKCYIRSGASRRPRQKGLFYSSLSFMIHKARRSCNLGQIYTQSSALLPKVTAISEACVRL